MGMFRNPVYDFVVLVPAFLIAGLFSFFIITPATHAADERVSTGASTLPDPDQRPTVLTRASLGEQATTSEAVATPRTADQLIAFAQYLLATDNRIEAIGLSPEEIQVSYRVEKRLLGVMTVAVPMVARVESDGQVTFSEPWYGPVTVSEVDRMRTALEVRVRSLLSSEGYIASTRLSPMTQGEILSIIHQLVG